MSTNDGGGGSSRCPVRVGPYPTEGKSSRLKQAVLYKKRNILVPYHEVAAIWRVPPSTLQRHATKLVKKRGGQTIFSLEQEAVFARHLLTCADALWPISSDQLKDYIQRFVSVHRIPASRFRNGTPGKDWIAGFLRRHPTLKKRRATAITASKAWATDAGKLQEFFGRLRPLLTEGPDFCSPDCVLNYDETAIGDDAGDPVVITRKTAKTPRAVLNNNRSNRSVMFSVTADGTCLAPFVCTKTKFKEEEIAAFSPPHCFYGTSKSGWFTMPVFDAWFEAVVVPWAASKGQRKKMIIGDNLSAHLSPVTLKRASEVGVFFRLLPPNTTHFLQPLDVAFFAPLKRAWKEQLLQYKRNTVNKSILKKHFAEQFQRLVSGVKSETIVSGFRACGLVPFDPQAAVSRMPCHRDANPADQDGAVLVASLQLNQQQRVQVRTSKRPPAGTELSLPPPQPEPQAPPPSPQPETATNTEQQQQQQQPQEPAPFPEEPMIAEQQQQPTCNEPTRRSNRPKNNRFPVLLLNRADPLLY